MNATSFTTRYRVIIPDTAGSAALLVETGDGWGLPGWSSEELVQWEDVRGVNAGVWDVLGLRVATLRAVALDWDEIPRTSFYSTENLDGDRRVPGNAHWVGGDDLDSVRWSRHRDREILASWFADEPSPRRVPWYRPGWFRSAEAWMRGELLRHGIRPVGDVEQVRSWERSSVMRVATAEGTIYSKAVPPQWGHEPELTGWLDRRYPGLVPSVVAVDGAGRRMLVRELQGRPLSEVADVSVWECAYASLARIQRAVVPSLHEIDRLGVSVRRLDVIQAGIDAMLHDERRMRIGLEGGLDRSETLRLQQAAPILREACRRLIDGPIPLSLDHGDFWPGNLIADGDTPVIFDWSDATISHPFFSLVMAVDEVDGALPGIPEAGKRVRDAYLREWAGFASDDELEALFDAAMLVAPLHQAMMYRDVYLPAMEFVDELDRMTPHFLRWLIRRLNAATGEE